MKISKVTAFSVKDGDPHVVSQAAAGKENLPGSDYHRIAPHRQLYSNRSQAALVRVETDEGVVGWGEAQAPVGTEIVLSVIADVVGPAVLGQDPLATTARHRDMYETNRVRGQIGGYQQDAIAAVDTALWDIRGRVAGVSIADLLGGRLRDRLPAYVTGLAAPTPEGRQAEAAGWVEQGFGVKPALGQGVDLDAAEIARLREAMGPGAWLALDALWGYTLPQAVALAHRLEEAQVAFFEAPLAPEDLAGHRRLRDATAVPIAVGEPLRTRHQFLPWFQGEALDVAQPDLMRNGVTETAAIAVLAETFHTPLALHAGVVTVVGMAATWQVASTLPGFAIQEFQPGMLDRFAPLSSIGLEVSGGELVVPTGPGLGIDIDVDRVAERSTQVVGLTA